ncbi:hypothetical protein [Streptomyces sp. NPDC048172]|uniref:hypothetical protein n=1 Tax=Streptomyces sp. NPDC048172 TaxID=3365505 RepID=UPI003711F3E1
MRHWSTSFLVALRFTLLGHVNNRLALLMGAVFNPGWVWVIGVCVPQTPLTFRLGVLDLRISTDISHSMQITSSLPGAASVIGFMMFMAAFKARDMDERLILAGYSRTALTLARLLAMALVAAALATQVTVLLRLASGAPQLAVLWLAAFSAALAYGGIGTMLGTLMRTELSGMFSVLAFIFMELTLQNPLTNPSADQDWLILLPLYGPAQTATAAVFTHTGPGVGLAALGLVWCAATTAAAATVLYVRTRAYHRHPAPAEIVVPASRHAPQLPGKASK